MKKYVKLSNVRDRKQRTNVYEVLAISDNDFLGTIQWYPPWRQYCFYPENSIFSSGCLEQIREFIRNLMVEQKNGLHGKEVEN